MVNKIRKTNALLLILAVGGSTIVGGLMFGGQIFAVDNATHAVVDFTAKIPDGPFIMKKGETKVFPIEIMTPRNKDVDLQVYVSETQDPLQPSPIKEQKFSLGMSASAGKNSVKLSPEAGTGLDVGTDYTIRDSTPLSITASQDATVGEHIISVTLFEDSSSGQKFITIYRTVKVEN